MTGSSSRPAFLAVLGYLASAVCGLAAACIAWLFYSLYWQWRGQFDEQGRYFHEPEGVVYHDQAFFLIVPACVLGVLAIALLRWAGALRRNRHGSPWRSLDCDASDHCGS